MFAVLVFGCQKSEDSKKKQVVHIPKGSNVSINTDGIVFENNKMDSDCTLTTVEKDGARTTTLNCE